MSENELSHIESTIAVNPLIGDVIPGTGGARKVRFAGRGKGKSGGCWAIHYYGGDDVPVFMLALIDKGVRADIGLRERGELAKVLSSIAGSRHAREHGS